VLADARRVDGITVLATRVEGLDDKGLREMADRLRDRIKSGVIVLGAAQGERALLLAAVTKDLVGRYHAGNIIKQLAPLVGGGGGGAPTSRRQAGRTPPVSTRRWPPPTTSWAPGVADPLAETPSAPAELRFADTRLFRELLGQHDEHMKTLERHVGVRIDVADTTLTLHGDPVETELASRVLTQLYGLLESGYPIYAADVDYALRILSSDRSAKLRDIFLDTVFISPTSASSRRRASRRRLHRRDPEFRHRVWHRPSWHRQDLFRDGDGDRRADEEQLQPHHSHAPAVEAGEKLGFLPGDLAEKVNPYLRPLYDALHDMVDFDRARRMVRAGDDSRSLPLAFSVAARSRRREPVLPHPAGADRRDRSPAIT
jgi:hypothetical protein